MTNNQSFHSEQAPAPVGKYPHARKVGNLLFLSGIGPRNPVDNSIPGLTLSPSGHYTTFDFEAQCHSVFQNVKHVLESCGARWEDLVDITVFLTNMERDFPVYNRIYGEYFAGESAPCRTTLGINSLPTPIAIELKCIAAVPN
ncbi:MAG: RidA family protein [Saprospiraceae bacterium]|nr:RidA family protein [Saprospiraceae bacterium]